MATMPVVLIRNPALIKQIFAKNFDVTFDPGWMRREDELAQYIPSMCPDKERWMSARKNLTPMFSVCRAGGENFAKISRQIDSMWTHTQEACLHGKPVNFKKVSMHFILDSKSNSFFGLEANSYEGKGDLVQLVENFEDQRLTRFIGVLTHIHFRGLQLFDSLKIIPRRVKDTLKSLIEKQIRKRTLDEKSENDFIDLLINTIKKDGEGKSNSELDISDQMAGLAFSLLFVVDITVGSQSLANSAIHLLSLYPEYQSRIRQEVDETLKTHNTTKFTYEVVRDLRILNQCLHETSRLYPTAPMVTRVCAEDLKVPGTDYTFKRGERIIFDPYSIMRDPKYFRNPDKFDPERFSEDRKGEIDLDAFLPFGSGPKKCPGNKVGLLIISTMISSLLHKYEIKPRSHVRQMDAQDFHPRTFANRFRDEILVDLVPLGGTPNERII